MKKSSKILSAALALVMCLSLLPVSAFAAGGESTVPPVIKTVVECSKHKYGAWETTEEATCTETGTKTRVCSVCGTTETKEIPAKGHTHDEGTDDAGWVVDKPATCGEEGLKHRHCSVCGVDYNYKTISIKDRPHTWEGSKTVEPTCGQDGYTVTVCTVCGAADETTKEITIPATGKHKYSGWSITKDPTCTETGTKTRVCSVCKGTEERTISAKGHTWAMGEDAGPAGWIVDEPATCVEEGSRHRFCSVCDYRDERSIPLTPHTEVVDERVEPTETTPGLTEGSHCSVCEEVLVAQEVIPALGSSTPTTPTFPTLPEISGDDDSGDVEINDVAVPLASGPVTRAEFVDYLWRHEGEPEGDATTFRDSQDHELARAIGWGQMIGIIYGRGSNDFAPDDLVTVSDVRLILERFAEVKGLDVDVYALVTLTGGEDEAVLNCDEVLAEFFGEELADQAA